MSEASNRHNDLVPELVAKVVTHTRSESEAMVVVESFLLGMILYYRPAPREAAEFLDSVTQRVIERMADDGSRA